MKIKIIDEDTIEIIKDDNTVTKKKINHSALKRLSSMPDKYRDKWWQV